MRVQVVREIPPCDQEGCNKPAEFGLVWLKQQFYCKEHAGKMLAIGEAMAHPVPAATIAQLKQEYPTQMPLGKALQQSTLLAFKPEIVIFAQKPWTVDSESVFRSGNEIILSTFYEFLSVEEATDLVKAAGGDIEAVIEVMREDK